eukprot:CAMPEP_0115015376 /NCGR_PEP_ID=MMETSP0216-20121206/26734_1 /TAXON_ID=223996 /ORGANISM="Protocruzia adherens, Strain Boccale" /LENGTH=43 /DNA_ID= /DNA_START= /DNA_END= /DNA_ORIENTATION=
MIRNILGTAAVLPDMNDSTIDGAGEAYPSKDKVMEAVLIDSRS